MDAAFVPGKQLSQMLFDEVVQPLLAQYYPRLAYSAGLFGYGSEVLGFDTPMSRDHDWGPRLQVFIRNSEPATLSQELFDFFAMQLPHQFHGYSTHFGPPNEADKGTRHLSLPDTERVSHRIEVHRWSDYLADYLPVNPLMPMTSVDWLLIPSQKLRTIANGSLYCDGTGELKPVIESLACYPKQVRYYLLASAWQRVGQEEHLMGRSGWVGDECGSSLLGSSLTRTLMQICFLLGNQYAPYPKWFGTAFQQLACAPVLTPLLLAVETADSWHKREAAFCAASSIIVKEMNQQQLCEPLSTNCTLFFGRPFSVIWGGQIADKLRASIHDPVLRALPLIGGVDLITSSTDVLENTQMCQRMRALYVTDQGTDFVGLPDE
ncbi:MAG: DUF4037 domain-containing protein [Anaerolineae bacterium]|nr:DUF4037 domain-containing protein [Anaerolineae bacterium]